MRATYLISLLLILNLAACSGHPEATCVVAGMSALANAGIYPSTKAEEINLLQCESIAKEIESKGCDLGVLEFVSTNPEAALRMFVHGGISFSESDLASTRSPMLVAKKACGW